MTRKKIAIIGSGPAGLTAAIYTSRADLDVIVFAGLQPGGQLTTTTEIENFPGFPTGIMGADLMENMKKQAERFGAKVEIGNIESITKNDDKTFTIKGQKYDAVIIATGASARYLGLKNEEEWIGKGYHSCATCDGFFYRDKIVAIVGGGDSAMEEANFLTKFATKVYIINRTQKFRASEIMLKRAQDNPKIEFILDSKITKFIGNEHIEQVELINTVSNEKNILDLNGVFVAIGHKPNSDIVKDLIPTSANGYLLPDKGMMTKVPGIFVAGDVTDFVYKQAITAAAGGCKAAIDCERWLENQE